MPAGLELIGMIGANNLDISGPIQDFRHTCQEWQNYDVNVHSIRVKHMRK